MKFKLITVGKTRAKAWQLAEQDYISRIRRYAQLQEISVREADQRALRNDELVKEQEAGRVLAKLDAADFVVALDERGEQFSSTQLADALRLKIDGGLKRIAFVVGGPLGLHSQLLRGADLTLSLSKMTLPHELAKVVLLEQIYRAFSIMRGEKYHKV